MNQKHEKGLASNQILYVIGTDEAGRGPLAGPVATAAACFRLMPDRSSPLFSFLNDSKVLSSDQRQGAIEKLLPERTSEFFKFAEEEHTDVFVSTLPKCNPSDTPTVEPLFLGCAMVLMPAATIDERNILEASLDGMCMCAAAIMQAVNDTYANGAGTPLLTKENTLILIDGPHIPWGLMNASQREKKLASMIKGLQRKAKLDAQKSAAPEVKPKRESKAAVVVPQYDRGDISCLDGVLGMGVVKGDALCPSIAAASIVAKVARDHFLEVTMHPAFPQYDFASHKGYPTQHHMDLLAKHGACVYHRRSFGPVTRALAHTNEHLKANKLVHSELS